jgi:hypothetical protein
MIKTVKNLVIGVKVLSAKMLEHSALWLALSTLALSTLIGCDEAVNSDYEEQIVVSAFLFEGQPIDSVVLDRTVPFGEFFDASTTGVEDAKVSVTVDGKTYQLLEGTASGYVPGRYYLPASDLIVTAGKTYELQVVTADGKHHVKASTRVPQPIRFTGIIDSLRRAGQGIMDTVVLDTNLFGGFVLPITAGPTPGGFAEPNQKYMIQVLSYDTLKKINTPIQGPPVDTASFSRYSFLQTAPLVPLSARLFGAFGRNRIAILAVDTNWVDYQRQVVNGRFLGYHPSLNHVEGGMGVWGSAARDTFTIYLKPKE